MKRFGGNSKILNGTTISRIGGKRIHVSEIPFHYSRFGGKRFPSKRVDILQRRGFSAPQLRFPTTFGSARSGLDSKRAIGTPSAVVRTTAGAQKFRDKYDKSLDKRVDEWMQKVNNLSLAEVNRYQFRRGRSTKPGFPVQQAGGQSSLVPSTKNLSTFSRPTQKSSGPSRYWLGPSRTKTSVSANKTTPRSVAPVPSAVPQVRPPAPLPSYSNPSSAGRLMKFPTIRLGPKKVSARAK